MVRPETKPDDVHGMIAAKGIPDQPRHTSHAAVVARQFLRCRLRGAEVMNIKLEQRLFIVQLDSGAVTVHEGDWISIDGGATGVFLGLLRDTGTRLRE